MLCHVTPVKWGLSHAGRHGYDTRLGGPVATRDANEVRPMGNSGWLGVRDEGDDNEDDDVFTRCY